MRTTLRIILSERISAFTGYFFSLILFVSNVLIKYWGKNLPYPEVPSGVMSGVLMRSCSVPDFRIFYWWAF